MLEAWILQNKGKERALARNGEWNILSVASSPFSGVELFLGQKLQFTLII